MRSTVVVFPFDLFGSAGTGAGAQLLGDAVREIIDDTAKETRPSRADAFRGKLRVKELAFETIEEVTDWRKRGRAAARSALKADDFLVWLSGNHLGVLPVFEELPADTLVVQFDAHLDINDFHDTTAELSHGNFLKHLPKPRPRFVHVGHRDLFQPPAPIATVFDAAYPVTDIATTPEQVSMELAKRARGAKHVWLDLDCDAFDPAFLPGVHQPLPFGLTPPAFLKLFQAVWSDKVLGISISEFDPGRDVRDASLNLLGWLIEFVLLQKHENETAA
jgi:arginase family enzyme